MPKRDSRTATEKTEGNKERYDAPRLTVYGKVSDLTRGTRVVGNDPGGAGYRNSQP